MTSEMELVVHSGGGVKCIYDEALDLRELGKLQITRASHVEPDAEGYWWADMGPSGGPGAIQDPDGGVGGGEGVAVGPQRAAHGPDQWLATAGLSISVTDHLQWECDWGFRTDLDRQITFA